jgi:hypothetical protein
MCFLTFLLPIYSDIDLEGEEKEGEDKRPRSHFTDVPLD